MSAEERFEPERMVEALNLAGVRYVVVGGLAVGALAEGLSELGAEHPVR